MKRKTCFLVGLITILSFAPSGFSISLHPFEQIKQDPKLFAKLEKLIHFAIAKNFGKPGQPPDLSEALWNIPVPLFITAKKGDQIRGCMGSLQSQQTSLTEEIKINLQKAFAQDPRHKPINFEEVAGMEIYLTAVGEPQPIASLDSIHPARDAVFIKNGQKESVILAGEAKTQSYLLKLARAKAGLKPGESFQIYRLPTKILQIKLLSKSFR